MQTHKNPGLRSGPAPYKAPSSISNGSATKAVAAPAAKPPTFVRDGKKWLIEYQKGNTGLLVEDAEMNNVVSGDAVRSSEHLLTSYSTALGVHVPLRELDPPDQGQNQQRCDGLVQEMLARLRQSGRVGRVCQLPERSDAGKRKQSSISTGSILYFFFVYFWGRSSARFPPSPSTRRTAARCICRRTRSPWRSSAPSRRR